ncbi:hypothetical protein U1Q18_028054 [Sarracenia purpurea var. burkii]
MTRLNRNDPRRVQGRDGGGGTALAKSNLLRGASRCRSVGVPGPRRRRHHRLGRDGCSGSPHGQRKWICGEEDERTQM